MSNLMQKVAGLIFDSSSHYLDHLAPFCALMGWPLVLTEPTIAETAKKYYPNLSIIEADHWQLNNILSDFRHIVSCYPESLIQAAIGPFDGECLWLPHGNSDKGHISPAFQALGTDSITLVYGQKMIDFMHAKKVHSQTIRIGGFRHLYYQKMQAFYDAMPIVSFAKKQQTLLYAPTWEDFENNCSFWQAFPKLAQELPKDVNLIVKLHPNTTTVHAPQIERLMGQHENGHLQFLLDFPPIFPLLSRSDVYLGDRSSIGYDFLFFDRPMLFFDPHEHTEGRDLTRCGKVVSPDHVYEHLFDNQTSFSSIRQSMRSYTFDEVSLPQLKRRLHALVSSASRR